MERNYSEEMDELKKQMDEMKKQMDEMKKVTEHVFLLKSEAEPTEHVGRIQKMKGMHPDPTIMTLMDRLENTTGQSEITGAITYLGVFSSGDRQSNWIKNELNIDQLLPLIENKTAGAVLNCIGNNDRLNILLAILRKPMTVAQLVSEYGYGSTGQVYHHIKPLLAADLIHEDDQNRGLYFVQPHRVQGIIMLLAGINDLVDPQFTKGNWEAQEE
ncbi:MAG: ArsR family transcriptional regulator [Herbinix sp.]|jgi:DNA-binding transcriptional regulator GbsR (MarR family)|nr:ArsR family transcriptional regulator [Herbinix sp.]